MRILHVITTISRGGAENQLMALIRLQRAAGHTLEVAYLREDGAWRRELEELGVVVADMRMRSFRVLPAAYRLRREIAAFKPDIINAHLQPAELCARLALLGTLRTDPPLVVTKHNLKVFARLPWANALARWTARRACALIAVSDAVKSLADATGCSSAAGRAYTVHNAIDVVPFDGRFRDQSRALRRGWAVAEDEVVIGTVGRLLPVKAMHVLVRAFGSYLKGTGRAARLVVVGRGPMRDDLVRLTRSLGLEQKVFFAGFREDIPALMGAFDIFALTSTSEGLPIAILEAMAAGKPVVATHVGGIPELVVDGVTGKMVPPEDPSAVAEALAFFNDAAVREAFGAAGRRRVLEGYTRDRMFRETMSVYLECLAVKR